MTTWARLAFFIQPEETADFERQFERRLLPILARYGLQEPQPVERPVPSGVFARLFAMPGHGVIRKIHIELGEDPAWQQALGRGRAAPPDFAFELYRVPAAPERSTAAGAGTCREGWHTLEVADGLLGPGVFDLVRDGTGRLWMHCWAQGLGCYDGEAFQQYAAFKNIACMYVDAADRLWMSTGRGLVCGDGEAFHCYTAADGLPDTFVQACGQDGQGRLWVGTKDGLYGFDGQTFFMAEGLSTRPITALVVAAKGGMWVGSAGGLYRFDGRCAKAVLTEADGLPDGRIRALLEGPAGELWIGTEQGLCCWDGNAVQVFTAADGLPHPEVKSLLLDRDQQLWIGTWGGLCRWDGNAFFPQDELPNKTVNALAAAADGRLWVGTHDGLSRSLAPYVTSFDRRHGLPHNVLSLARRGDGTLFFGTGLGLCRYDGTSFRTYTAEDGWPGGMLFDIRVDRSGRVWCSGPLSCFDDERFRRYTVADGLPEQDVHSLCEDRQGRMWIGTWGGHIGYIEDQRYTAITGERPLGNTVMCVLEDGQGQLWVGTAGLGAYRYYGDRFCAIDSLQDQFVHDIVEDAAGTVWLATEDGLYCIDASGCTRYTTEDGLVHNHIQGLLIDRRGQLLIGTWGGGINRFDGRVFQRFDKRDGLISNAVQQVLEDEDGALWIATEGGVTRYQPQTIPPSVRRLRLVADRVYTPKDAIAVPVSQRHLRFEFAGRSPSTRPDGLVYVARLRSIDADWKAVYVDWVAYEDLPVGDYVFEVRAVDRDLNYSEPVQLRFAIEADAQLQSMKAVLAQSGPQGRFVGRSPALQQVQDTLRRVAPADLGVLILGETGTGKGLAAQTLHRLSPRRDHPLMLVDCGSLPESLVESELFGHEKGAFTGAVARRLGKVELAQGGTLFLDEIGDLPLAAQVKLLRLLEERHFERVGGNRVLEADVRVVAATNRDLRQMVEAGTFRQDLFFRLQGMEVQLPPLRQRREDIPLLALYFIGPKAAHLDKPAPKLSAAAEAALMAHDWPGNVRELQHAIERAVVVCRGQTIEAADLMLGAAVGAGGEGGAVVTLAENERRHIEAVLRATKGRISGPEGAAGLLGVPESTLRNRMKKLGIRRP